MLPSDPKLTKLRLKAERAKRQKEKLAAAARDYRIKVAEPAQLEFIRAAKELGYCGHCELPLGECKCIPLAKSTERDAALSEAMEIVSKHLYSAGLDKLRSVIVNEIAGKR